MTNSLRVAAVLCCLVLAASARTSETTEEPMVTRANAGKPGMPVPEALLRYRDSTAWVANSLVCIDPIPRSDDSFMVFYAITNYSLLNAILFSAHDRRIFDLADKRALLVGGPNRFYEDLTAGLRRRPALSSQERFRELRARAHQRQMVVGKLYTRDNDLSYQQASAAFKQAAANLQAGMTFEQAALRCQKTYVSPGDATSSLIADGGLDILVGPKPTEMFTSGFAESVQAHRLMKARPADTFIVHDGKTGQTAFYAIREVYDPAR